MDPDWPGLSAPDTEIEAEPDTLEQFGQQLCTLADDMERDHPSYGPTGDYYMADTRRSTTVGLEEATETNGQRWFGRWRTASEMEHMLRMGRYGLLKHYRLLAAQLRAAGLLLEATAEDYRRTDQGAKAALEQRAAGWDQIAAQDESSAGPPGGQIHDTVEIPTLTTPLEDASGYPAEWVLEQINAVRRESPWLRLNSAASAFGSTADRLTGLTEQLKSKAITLDGEWQSETSAACQKALQRIGGTAEHLGLCAQNLSDYSYRSAEELQAAVSGFPDTELSGWESFTDTINPLGDGNMEEKEGQVRDAFNRLNQAYFDVSLTTMPNQVAVNLPDLPDPEDREPLPSFPPPSAPTPDLPPPLAPMAPMAPPTGGPDSSGSGIPGFVGTPADLVNTPGAPDLPGVDVPGVDVPGAPEPLPEDPGGGLAGTGPGPVGPGPGIGPAPGPGPGVGPGPGPGPGTVPAGTPGPGVGPGIGPTGPGVTPAGRPGTGPGVVPAGRGGPGGPSGGGTRPSTGGARPGPGTGAGMRPGMTGVTPAAGARPGATGTGPAARPGVVGTGPGARPGAAGGTGAKPGGAGGSPGAAGGKPGAAGGGGNTGAGGGRSGAAGGRTGMVPMSGAGRGSDKEHSRHDSWLEEDQDPWHGDDEGIPPPVIR